MATPKRAPQRPSEDRVEFATVANSLLPGAGIDYTAERVQNAMLVTGPFTRVLPSGAIQWKSEFRDQLDTKLLRWGFYDDVLVRDAQCEAAFGKRHRALAGMPLTVRPAKGERSTPEARKRAAETQSAIYAIQHITRALGLLVRTYLLKGFAPTQIVPGARRGQLRIGIDQLLWLDPTMVFFSTDGHMHYRDNRDVYVGRDLTAERPGQFFAPAMDPTPLNPYAVGLGEKFLRPFWLSTEGGIKAWAVGCERLGIPVRDISVKKTAWEKKGTKDTVRTQARGINRDAIFLHDEDITLTILSANAAGMAETFDKFCRFLDEYKSKIASGEVLTTDTAVRGSSEIAAGHREVRAEVSKADAAHLQEWLTESLVGFYETVNYGVEDPSEWSQVVIGDDVGTPTGPELVGKVFLLRTARAEGVPVTVEQYQRLGVDPPKDGETVLPPPSVMPSAATDGGGMPGMPGMPGMAVAGGGAPRFAVDDRTALLEGALGPLAASYRALIEATPGVPPGKA